MTRLRFFTVAALACLAATTPLAAQTFPTNDPIIRHIYAMGMDSTHLFQEAHVLFDSLGPRLMGTPNIKRAQDWLTATRIQVVGHRCQRKRSTGTWIRGWIRHSTSISSSRACARLKDRWWATRRGPMASRSR